MTLEVWISLEVFANSVPCCAVDANASPWIQKSKSDIKEEAAREENQENVNKTKMKNDAFAFRIGHFDF